MRRFPIRALLLLLPLAATAGCPEPRPPGDVQYGEYVVEATLMDGGCVLSPEVQRPGSFEFFARLGADVDGGPAYLTVAQPPTAVLQQPRRGEVSDGGFAFSTRQPQDLDPCGCLVEVAETIRLDPVTDGADGGFPEAPIPDLPAPEAIGGLLGRTDYVMTSGGACDPPVLDGDGGVVEGCRLPCSFGYELEGRRLDVPEAE